LVEPNKNCKTKWKEGETCKIRQTKKAAKVKSREEKEVKKTTKKEAA